MASRVISSDNAESEANWINATTLEELSNTGVKVVRYQRKQIAIFHTESGLYACNNRCPHQGYPLSEGVLSDQCTLTCNWHNWKFDLRDGSNLVGSDSVRVYPTKIIEDQVWIDVADPPYERQYEELLGNLKRAMQDNSYEHIAREISRLQILGADLGRVMAEAILWSHDKLEYGWTHAYAGAADWLALYHELKNNKELQLVCVLETLGHIADDTLRRPEFPYSEELLPYDRESFLAAIETENQREAIGLLNGAFRKGMVFEDLEEAFSTAALAHYNDFGHSLIYVSKVSQLVEHLGPVVEPALLLPLTRSLLYARREDLIPQFRHYGETLDQLGTSKPNHEIDWRDFVGASVNRALDRVAVLDFEQPEQIFRELLKAVADQMLSFNLDFQDSTTNQIDDNVGWLSFTHAITFANAVHRQCRKFPKLWPCGLLQMAWAPLLIDDFPDFFSVPQPVSDNYGLTYGMSRSFRSLDA